jgi:hypothetical protein
VARSLPVRPAHGGSFTGETVFAVTRSSIAASNSFNTVAVYGAPYAYWPYYDTSLYSKPLAYSPPPTYVLPYTPPVNNTFSMSPPSSPTPSVVEFPTGRYELRGDGITEPYRWVWIPKPPTTPPAKPSSPVPPTSGEPEPTRHTALYR